MSFFSNKKINTKADYDSVFSKRAVLNSRGFKMFWGLNKREFPRIGVSVAKRNIAKAVNRNRFKRLAKESFRLNIDVLPAIDIIVVIKKEALLQTNEAFFAELDNKWRQLASTVNTK